MQNSEGNSFLSRSYVTNGAKATRIWFVYSKDDFSNPNAKSYRPSYCHQVYGSNETIFGYRNLSINIFYNGITMDCYADIKFSKKVDETGKIKADNVIKMLHSWLPAGFGTDKCSFIEKMEDQAATMYGTVKNEFMLELPCGDVSNFKITEVLVDESGFREFHDKFQRVIVWYIEAASLIDLTDTRWMVFYVYQHRNGDHCPVGFCTVYRYYKHPEKTRARISQFFILPSHQRIGLGSKLLETVYKCFAKDENVVDITVEDPSLAFQRLRDYVDCNLLCNVRQFSRLLVLKQPFSKNSAEVAETCYKMYLQQARRIYDILNLYYAGNDTNYLTEWCRRMKNRFKWSYQKAIKMKRRNGYYNLRLQKFLKSKKFRDNVINRRFKQYLEDIYPTVSKLQRNLGGEATRCTRIKQIWTKVYL